MEITKRTVTTTNIVTGHSLVSTMYIISEFLGGPSIEVCADNMRELRHLISRAVCHPDDLALMPLEKTVAVADKFGAIRIYRMRTGQELKKAKDVVEAFLAEKLQCRAEPGTAVCLDIPFFP